MAFVRWPRLRPPGAGRSRFGASTRAVANAIAADMLPARVTIAGQEALDCFLERLADVNGMQPSILVKLLSRPEGFNTATTAFLMVKPDDCVVSRISELSGVDAHGVEAATLSRFGDNLPLQLEGFDPRHRQSFRAVVAQGWFPPFGSQVCPRCLATDGIWWIHWRLPIVATCPEHRVFLVTECAGCGKRFRTHRHSPLRPLLGPNQPCANPIGLRNPCQRSVISHPAQAAEANVVDMTTAVLYALEGQSVPMLGTDVDPRLFLAELRHLATLLLHVVSQPAGLTAAPWAHEVHTEAALRTTSSRGPRWSLTPPSSSVARGQVLAQGYEMLRQPNVEDAAALLAPWIGLIGGLSGGPADWLLNRTTRSATMRRLIAAATARRGYVGRRLTARGTACSVRPQAIPQLVDTDIYVEVFAGMLDTHPWTGRLYVSLCIARATSSKLSWPKAAAAIGLDPGVGCRTAKAASARMLLTPTAFAAAVDIAAHRLPTDRDFRQREERVQWLAQNSGSWFDAWRGSMSPARRQVALPYAITWMWCEVAQGLLDVSPAWPDAPTRQMRAAYRAFRARLPASAQRDLRELVLAAG